MPQCRVSIYVQPRHGRVRTVVLMFIRPFNPPKDKETRLSRRPSLLRGPRAGGWTTGYMQECPVKEPWHSLAFKHSTNSHPVHVKRSPVLFTLQRIRNLLAVTTFSSLHSKETYSEHQITVPRQRAIIPTRIPPTKCLSTHSWLSNMPSRLNLTPCKAASREGDSVQCVK